MTAFEYFKNVAWYLGEVNHAELQRAVDLLKAAREGFHTVWIVGNGGSAATAGHFANDLVKMCDIQAISVPHQLPSILAYGNDNGWDNMFAHYMNNFLGVNDVVVAISCSGESDNVINAARGIENLIVMTGNNLESRLALIKPVPKAFLHVASDDITVQEDVHLVMCHAIVKELCDG